MTELSRVAGLHLPPDRPLPAVPDGWHIGPPDFVGVGAQRCGTTRWYALIVSHPDVHSGYGKEQHYFDRFWQLPVAEAEIDGYGRRFPRPPGRLIGEWTPRYMSDAWTPPLLARAAPEAKLLVLLRDPVARFRSGVGRLVRRDGELAADTRNGVDQIWRGRYAEQLAALYEHFPRERILIQQYERCVADPAGEIARTYRFLGLDPGYGPPPSLHARLNSAEEHSSLSADMATELRRLYAADLRRLPELAPEIDLGLWPSAAGLGRDAQASTSVP